MPSPLDDLTQAQIDWLDGGPGKHGNPLGTEALSYLLGQRIAELGKIYSNTAVIPAASATVVLAVGEAYDGKPATAMIFQAAADGTLTSILRCSWDGNGNLTVHGNAAATADVDICYFVDGR